MNRPVEARIGRWLVEAGIVGVSPFGLIEGLAQRLNAEGFGIRRIAVASDILHPLHRARGFLWEAERGTWQEDYGSDGRDHEDWQRGPFAHMLRTDSLTLRRRLDGDYRPGEFPFLDRLRSEGATDYFARVVGFGEAASLGRVEGIIGSWTSDRPGGFTEDQIGCLEALIPRFALAFKAATTVLTARELLATYLGPDAAGRVLDGEIRRGEARTVDAVLWYSDLKGFTRIADSTPADALICMLNDYAETLVDVIHGRGGEVLKFVGDGILAIFHPGTVSDACASALDAAIDAERAIAALNDRSAARDFPITDFYLGLHRGRVHYGNIGARERLDFTVIGRAVNEVARIEAMCRQLEQKVIISAAFAEAAGSSRDRLVSLGRYMLRGVRRPRELFTLDPEARDGSVDEPAEEVEIDVAAGEDHG